MKSVFGIHIFGLIKGFAILVLCALFVACGGAPSGGTSGETILSDTDLTIEYIGASSQDLVVLGQGGLETSVITFLVKDTAGALISGSFVEFSLSSTVGGIELTGGVSGITGSDGKVATVLQSGTVSTSVRVTASVDGLYATSDDISISGGSLVGGRLDLTVIIGANTGLTDGPPLGDPAGDFIEVYEGAVLSGVEIELQVIARDLFGNAVEDGSRVSFWSPESGLVESSCNLVGGICQVTWITASPLPTSTISVPTGRWVTVLVHGSGAESFADLNGNNLFDSDSESWADLPEPYVDGNENGQYDVGEFFVDTDGNQLYDASGDGVWNGPAAGNYTNVWTSIHFHLSAEEAPSEEE